MPPSELIQYIVWYATQQDVKLTTNRLVKFLYLADLYHARIKSGKTITGFPWRFIHYGPYCREAWEEIEKASVKGLICKETYESNFGEEKEYSIFGCRDKTAEELAEKIHLGVLGQLQNAIKKLGDDTPQLLDYVYFETEPMQGVRKGDLLDFLKSSKPDPIKKIELKKLSPETIRKARERINKLSEKMKHDRNRLLANIKETEKYKDNIYYDFLRFIDGEELDVGLKGIAKIRMTE